MLQRHIHILNNNLCVLIQNVIIYFVNDFILLYLD